METGFPRHAVIISQSTLSIQNNTLVIVLSSATQEDLFRTDILKEFKQRICQRLSLTTFQIQVTIAEPVEKTAKPYSSNEKYNYLLEKNQNLAKLKERFNLNIKS